MEVLCLIPARLKSTRLPRKLIQKIGDKTVIEHVYNRAQKANIFWKIVVVTDSREIADCIEGFGGNHFLMEQEFEDGTQRIAHAVDKIDPDRKSDFVINLQGDLPFVNPSILHKVLHPFYEQRAWGSATVCTPIADKFLFYSSDTVKVVFNKNKRAMYFSRSPIPWPNPKYKEVEYYQHIGIYAFARGFMRHLRGMKQSKYASIEKLEQLKILDNDMNMHVTVVDEPAIEINTEWDLIEARRFYQNVFLKLQK